MQRSSDDPNSSLLRVVGLWGAVWMGLGSILGTGVFVSLGIAAGVAGAGVVIAVMLASLVATSNGLSSAQLAAVHPVSGGTYEYGHRFVHPVAGFAAGWMFLAAKSASAATAALGCSGYLLHALGLSSAHTARVAVALLLVFVFTALVAGGVRRSNRANIVIVSLTILALVSFVLIGWHSIGVVGSEGTGTGEPLPEFLSSASDSLPSLLNATALMFVAYTGYGRIATLGEEIREPARNIPRAIIVTLVLSMVLYVAVAWTAVAAVGPEAFAESTREAAAPLEVVALMLGYPGVARFIAVGAVTAMAGVLLNLLLGLSRVLLAMARRGEMPSTLAHISPSTSNPTRAVWTVGAFIAALVQLGDFELTWSFSALTVLVYYGLTNLAALRLPPESRLFPRWIAVAGLLTCFGLTFFIERRIWIAGMVLTGVGFLIRHWVRRLS